MIDSLRETYLLGRPMPFINFSRFSELDYHFQMCLVNYSKYSEQIPIREVDLVRSATDFSTVISFFQQIVFPVCVLVLSMTLLVIGFGKLPLQIKLLIFAIPQVINIINILNG